VNRLFFVDQPIKIKFSRFMPNNYKLNEIYFPVKLFYSSLEMAVAAASLRQARMALARK
jgi:hypothetical protein